MLNHQRKLLALLLLFTLHLTGCALPNTQPFADATLELHTQLRDAGNLTQQQLLQSSTDSQAINQFQADWLVRLTVFEALTHYTETLAAISDRPSQEAEFIQALAGTFEQLASLSRTLASNPATPIAKESLALIELLQRSVNEVRAQRELQNLTKQMQPLIEATTQAVRKDLKELITLAAVHHDEVSTALDDAYRLHRFYRDKLLALRSKHRAKIDALIQPHDLDTDQAATFKALTELDHQLRLTDEDEANYQSTRRKFDTTLALQTQALQQLDQSLLLWQKSHTQLTHILNHPTPTQRILSTRPILQRLAEIRQTLDRLQQHETRGVTP